MVAFFALRTVRQWGEADCRVCLQSNKSIAHTGIDVKMIANANGNEPALYSEKIDFSGILLYTDIGTRLREVERMKLIVAIVQDEDASRLISDLMTDGFGVTKLATTGGFLRAGNTTLLVGVEDDRFDAAMAIIEKICKSRKQIAASPVSMVGVPGAYTPYPIEVVVGGATIFVLTVDQFVKL